MQKAIVVYSGGMDSFTLLHKAVQVVGAENVTAVSFHYGQRHRRELEAAMKVTTGLGVRHRVFNIDGIMGPSALTAGGGEVPEGHYADDNMKQTVVPNRNMIMLSIAVGVAESWADKSGETSVWYGAHAGDHAIYPDCRPDFVAHMSAAAWTGTYHGISIEAPFLKLSKGGILWHGLNRLSLNAEDYAATWTCYKGGAQPCGKCGACVERLEAFMENSVADPLEYE